MDALPASMPARRLPRQTVFGWVSCGREHVVDVAVLDALPQKSLTSSGRAAIYQALQQLNLPTGTKVLVPSYHCPTMVAPLVCAGLSPAFYGLDEQGNPNLEGIAPELVKNAGAIIVAHYFGLARSLAQVRHWCDAHSIALIEDCAHCYFGATGERDIGRWGDFAIASLTKFFPVPEAGLLASGTRQLKPLSLQALSPPHQVKAIVDVLELASSHRKLWGLNAVLSRVFALKSRRRPTSNPGGLTPTAESTASRIAECDMARIAQSPSLLARLLATTLPRGRVMARRRQNFGQFAVELADIDGCPPLPALARVGGSLRLSTLGRGRRPGVSSAAKVEHAGIPMRSSVAGRACAARRGRRVVVTPSAATAVSPRFERSGYSPCRADHPQRIGTGLTPHD